jgi:hypothetical protein
MKFVSTVNDFQRNLKIRFLSDTWIEAIDFEKLIIVGGCVVNALCQLPFPDAREQDINIINISNSLADSKKAIENVIQQLRIISSQYSHHQVKVEELSGPWHYNIFLPCGIKLNFTRVHAQCSANAISRMLYNFNMDVCQVAFTGNFISNMLGVSIFMLLC